MGEGVGEGLMGVWGRGWGRREKNEGGGGGGVGAGARVGGGDLSGVWGVWDRGLESGFGSRDWGNRESGKGESRTWRAKWNGANSFITVAGEREGKRGRFLRG